MSEDSSSTGTPTAITTATYLYGPQDPKMFPVIPCFVVPPANFNDGIFPTKIILSASKISFVNITTGRLSAPSFTNADYAAKETSVDAFPHHCLSTILCLVVL